MISIQEMSVLVVEDSGVQRLLAVDLLRRMGVGYITEAANGHEALHHLQSTQHRIDVVLTDLEMPGMDGVELVQKLAAGHLVNAVVLMTSLDPMLMSAVEAIAGQYKLSVLGVLQKPLKLSALTAVLKNGVQCLEASPQEVPECSVDDIGAALYDGQMELHFQPKVTLRTGLLRAVEGLIRWRHPDAGLVLPKSFIPKSEASGLIEPLTEWVLQEGLKWLHDWHKRGLAIDLSLNISAVSLARPDFADEIEKFTLMFGLGARHLTLEIAESPLMTNLSSSLGCLARLRLKGFGLSIDDFGSGFSALQQLARLPFTELKIDRSLVNSAAGNVQKTDMLQSMVGVGQRLKLLTVAEGVESLDDWRLLRGLGCDMAQGYLIAHPMPGDDLLAWTHGEAERLRQFS